MGWFTDWFKNAEPEFDKPVAPGDTTEVSVLVKIIYEDGGTKDHVASLPRNEIPELVKDLMKFYDVREARVYEEVSHHRKDDLSIATIALGTALGANFTGTR